MTRVVAGLVALCGCGRYFGLEPPTPLADASTDTPDDGRGAVVDGPGDSLVRTTVSFRQGLAGYTGGTDTYIDEGSPMSTRATDSNLRLRQNVSGRRAPLIKFDAIFGAGASQIPSGAVIELAVLEVIVSQSNSVGIVCESAFGWSPAVTWDTFGASAGIDAEDIARAVNALPVGTGAQQVDVTTSVAGWVSSPAANFGWVIVPSGSDAGDTLLRSNEDGEIAMRPRLVVTYAR